MAGISILQPQDQFAGKTRLLAELRNCLMEASFSQFRLAVAFAKSAPLAKLFLDLKAWRESKKVSLAIIGLNHKGTSQQALQLALQLFDETYVCFPGSLSTFHPKMYIFEGPNSARCFLGSHNLTVGGTETNFEAGVRIDLTLPDDRPLLNDVRTGWDALLPAKCPFTRRLDTALLKDLIAEEFLFDETRPAERFGTPKKTAVDPGKAKATLFPLAYPKPPAPVPKGVLGPVAHKKTKTGAKTVPPSPVSTPALTPSPTPSSVGDSLLIQIVPHHNGEVFLSKIAVNQNPGFFGFPFKGKTVPKKDSNASYPQRAPDPVVDISVFDKKGSLVIRKPTFPLNTVFYEKKGEIRITFSPDILKATSPFAVMHMRAGDSSCDYYLDVYNEGSLQHSEFLAACNQTLPSGGADKARKMGWL